MGLITSCFEPTFADVSHTTETLQRPRSIQGRRWSELGRQLEEKRNIAVEASNREEVEREKAKTYQIVMLHQAMHSAKSAERRRSYWRRRRRQSRRADVQESIEV